MPLTNDGAEVIAQRLMDTGTAYDNANAHIGVGDGTTAFDKTQSDLIGTNKERAGMDSGYPSITGAQLTFRSTFGENDANFSWEEWAVFNDASAGDMLNRVVEDNGEKVSGHVWEFTVEITVQA